MDKKEAKRLYDIEYRRKNRDKHILIKKAYYVKNKEKLAIKQKERRKTDSAYVERHNEYCRQPEYRKYKHKYDVVKRMMDNYGEYWECAVLVNHIEKEIRRWIPKNERYYYVNNRSNQNERNKRRRIYTVLNDIVNGDADFKVLQRAWKKETREMFADLLGEKY